MSLNWRSRAVRDTFCANYTRRRYINSSQSPHILVPRRGHRLPRLMACQPAITAPPHPPSHHEVCSGLRNFQNRSWQHWWHEWARASQQIPREATPAGTGHAPRYTDLFVTTIDQTSLSMTSQDFVISVKKIDQLKKPLARVDGGAQSTSAVGVCDQYSPGGDRAEPDRKLYEVLL